jgi:hypothetical protein
MDVFQQEGYLKISKAFPEEKMEAMVGITENLLASPAYQHDQLIENGHVKKLLYLFEKHESFLELLVSQPIIDILKNYCENVTQVVVTWEDMVIKLPFSNSGFKPHQDLPLQSVNSPVFTAAIYFRPSLEAPVSFLPRSHLLGPLTRTQLQELCKKEEQNFIAVPAEAGDIIIHNAKTVHRSQNNQTALSRYTWYLEFRTVNQLRHDSLWDEQWIMKRRAIFVYALLKYRPELVVELAPDVKELQVYLDTIQLKVPHVTDTVNYDMESPYYHF